MNRNYGICLRLAAWTALGVVLPVAAVLAAGQFDGSYAGPQRETRNNNSGYCQNINRDAVRVTVADNHFSYKWGVPIEVQVGPNGAFETTVEGLKGFKTATNLVTMKGQITGGTLEADVGSANCGAHLSLKKG